MVGVQSFSDRGPTTTVTLEYRFGDSVIKEPGREWTRLHSPSLPLVFVKKG